MPSFRVLVVMHFEMRDEYCSTAEMKSAGSMSGGGLTTTRTEHREYQITDYRGEKMLAE
jgi:hypothetical protein